MDGPKLRQFEATGSHLCCFFSCFLPGDRIIPGFLQGGATWISQESTGHGGWGQVFVPFVEHGSVVKDCLFEGVANFLTRGGKKTPGWGGGEGRGREPTAINPFPSPSRPHGQFHRVSRFCFSELASSRLAPLRHACVQSAPLALPGVKKRLLGEPKPEAVAPQVPGVLPGPSRWTPARAHDFDGLRGIKVRKCIWGGG